MVTSSLPTKRSSKRSPLRPKIGIRSCTNKQYTMSHVSRVSLYTGTQYLAAFTCFNVVLVFAA